MPPSAKVREWLPLVMAVVLFMVLYAPALNWLALCWWWNLDSFVGMVAVPLSFVLAYMRWKAIGVTESAQDVRGLWLAFVALIVCLAGYATAQMLLSCLSLPLMIYALVLWLWGGKYARQLAFPIAFLFFALPVFELLEIYLSFPMRLGATALAAYILAPVMQVSFTGTQIITPGLEVAVIASCSGLNYLTTLLMLGVLFSWLFLSRTGERLLLMALILPIVLLANGMRVATVGLLGNSFGRDVAIGFFHDFSGMLVFALAVTGMIGAAQLIRHA